MSIDLNEIEQRARNVLAEYGDTAVVLLKAADVLALVARVRELEAATLAIDPNQPTVATDTVALFLTKKVSP